MHIKVDIDCTPAEARAFLGLPDLAPVHAVFVDQLTGMMKDGLSPTDMQRMFSGWFPMMEGGLDAWNKAMTAMVSSSLNNTKGQGGAR